MNRFLTFPLVVTLIVFSAVVYTNRFTGEPAEAALASTSSTYDAVADGNLMTDDQIRTMLLDQWPIEEYRIMSRAMALPTLAARVGFAELHTVKGRNGNQNVLAKFWVKGRPKTTKSDTEDPFMSRSQHFAVHVNRVTGQAHIYADGWRAYNEWRDENLPKYKAATGWKE